MSASKDPFNENYYIKEGKKYEAVKSYERDYTCIIVYSSDSHVEYINALLYIIEKTLEDYNIRPQRLGEEIRSTEDYLKKLEELVDNCVLGIIILDGFRPNVLFEFGMLKGKKKPIIVLQNKDAEINIKNFYKGSEESGLDEENFKILQNPKINVGIHLSDFSGKHICYIDWKSNKENKLYPVTVLKENIEKTLDQIMDEFKKIASMNVNIGYSEDITEPLFFFMKHYFSIASSKNDVDELIKTYEYVKDISSKYAIKIPLEVNDMIASTFMFISNDANIDVNIRKNCIMLAQNIYNNIISSINKNDKEELYVKTMKKIGDIFLQLVEIEDDGGY